MQPHGIAYRHARWYQYRPPGDDRRCCVLIAPAGKPLVKFHDLDRAGKDTYRGIVAPPGLRNAPKALYNLDATIAECLGGGRYVFVMFEDAADVEWLRGLRWLG